MFTGYTGVWCSCGELRNTWFKMTSHTPRWLDKCEVTHFLKQIIRLNNTFIRSLFPPCCLQRIVGDFYTKWFAHSIPLHLPNGSFPCCFFIPVDFNAKEKPTKENKAEKRLLDKLRTSSPDLRAGISLSDPDLCLVQPLRTLAPKTPGRNVHMPRGRPHWEASSRLCTNAACAGTHLRCSCQFG